MAINNGDLPLQTYIEPGSPQKPLLTPEKRQALERCEAVMSKGMAYVFEMGAALRVIQKRKLYLDYGSFEDYCEKRWRIHRSLAYRWIGAARILKVLSPIGDTVPMPEGEYQVRALCQTHLGAADCRKIWRDAVASAPVGGVTGRIVAQKIAELRAMRGELGRKPAGPATAAVKVDRATVHIWYNQITYALKAVQNGDPAYAEELLSDLGRRLLEISACRVVFRSSAGSPDYEI